VTDLKWPEVAVLLALLVVGLLLFWLRRPRDPAGALLVAHTDRLRRLPRYRALARRELLVAGIRTIGAMLVVAGAVLLVARPVRAVVEEPDRSARDIELCLDVSASMDPWNEQVVQRFRAIVDELDGERIGLTIFSGAAVTIVPITDDYEFVTDALDEAAAAFADSDYDFFVGAEAPGKRASQIGDGLVSCTQRFDRTSDHRGRAVVLASDNDPQGRQVFSLAEASAYAARRQVVAYAIAPQSVAREPDRAAALQDAAASTGGLLTVLEDPSGVSDVVARIERLERARLDTTPTSMQVDHPQAPFWLACAGLLVLVAGSLVGGRR
jgi:Ca-activated chloride channel homolog